MLHPARIGGRLRFPAPGSSVKFAACCQTPPQWDPRCLHPGTLFHSAMKRRCRPPRGSRVWNLEEPLVGASVAHLYQFWVGAQLLASKQGLLEVCSLLIDFISHMELLSCLDNFHGWWNTTRVSVAWSQSVCLVSFVNHPSGINHMWFRELFQVLVRQHM